MSPHVEAWLIPLIIAIALLALGVAGIASINLSPRRAANSNVAKYGRESGILDQWPTENDDMDRTLGKLTTRPGLPNPYVEDNSIGADGDPINQPPAAIQPILFEDGYKVTLEELRVRGLTLLVDANGRIQRIIRLETDDPNYKPSLLPTDSVRSINMSVEEWAGHQHGARIS